MNLSGNVFNKLMTVLGAGLLLLAGCASSNMPLHFDPGVHRGGRIAVLPIGNLSGSPAPQAEIRRSFMEELRRKGFDIMGAESLSQFMEQYRMRDTGGLTSEMARAFKEDAGAAGVLMIALERYEEKDPPKIAISARLVSTGDNAGILWVDSVSLAGDDAPGLLGLGLIEDQKTLLNMAMGRLADSLVAYFSGYEVSYDRSGRRFKPKVDYVSAAVGIDLRSVIINFALRRSGGDEHTTPAKIDVSLSAVSSRKVTVEYTVTGGTAAEGRDFSLKDGSLVFEPGELSKNIRIGLLDDRLYRGDRTVEVTLSNPVNAVLGKQTVHTYTIIDNDPQPSVTFHTSAQEVRENGGAVTVTAQLSAVSGKDVTVPFTVSGTAQEGIDHAITPGPLVIKAGETSETITIKPMDDPLYEDNETVVVTMVMPVNATPGAQPVSIITIRDNDPPPAAAFALKDSSGDEGKSPAKINVSLSAAGGKRAIVEYTVTGGTAVSSKNFVLKSGALVFEPGETTRTIDLGLIDDKLHDDNKMIEVTLLNPVNAVLGTQTVHTHTIVDNDPPPSVTFSASAQEVRENSGAVTVTAQLSAISGKDVALPFTLSGTAVAGKNYQGMTPSPLTIKAGSIPGEITLALMDNSLYEDNKTIMVAMGSPVNATPGAQTMHTVAIVEDDPPPSIEFLVKASEGEEGKTPARIDVSLSHASEKQGRVEYAVTGGTAVNNKDYILKSGALVFELGETTRTIDLAIIDDKLHNDNKTIEVTLLNPVNARLGTQTMHTHAIIENDPPPSVTFSASAQEVRENGGAVTVTAQLSAVSGKDVTVPFTAGGTAQKRTNYTITPGPLVIKAGETGGTITIKPVDDHLYKDNETVIVTMGMPVNATVGEHQVHTATITENDPPPVVSFVSQKSRGNEGKSPAKIVVSLSEAGGKRATVEYAVTGGTAENGKDYTLKNDTLVFEPGELSKLIDIGVINDKLREDSETIEVTLSNPINAIPGKQTVHTYTIIDNDPAPTVTFASQRQEIKEDSGEVTASVNLSAVAGKDVIVPFTLSGTAFDGKNYRVITPNPLTIKAGLATAGITFSLMDDKRYEDAKTIIVTLGTPVNAATGARRVHRVTIKEDDPSPVAGFVLKGSSADEGKSPRKIDVSLSTAGGKQTVHTYTIVENDPQLSVTFTSARQEVLENGGAATVTAQLSAISGKDVTVPFTVSGTAQEGIDHAITPGPLVIKAGETSGTITIKPMDDPLYENNETIVVTMGTAVNATAGAHPVSITTIRDNDPPPAAAFALKDSGGDEGKSPAKINVSLSTASEKKTSVEYAVTGGTAVSSKNFVLKNGALVFGPGETTKAIDLAIIDNKLYDDNKTVEVTLLNPVNALLGTQTVHTRAIIENDSPPSVTFSASAQDVRENGGEVTVTARLSTESGKDVTLPFTLSGTAVAGKNYQVMTPSPLTIKAGATTAGITLALLDNSLYEDNRTIMVIIETPVNATPGAQTMHTVAIVEDDPPPAIDFLLKNFQGNEGKSPAKIDVSLNRAGGKRAIVEYAVTGGTAVSSKDYVLQNGALVFEPGETTRTIDLGIIDDILYNDNKTIEVTLLNPVNAVLGTQTMHTHAIIENDPPPSVTFTSTRQEVLENGGEVTVTAQLSAVSGKDVTVPLTVIGTAREGIDYAITQGPLVIKAGETIGTITITAVDDTIFEDNETIVVTMVTPVNAIPGAQPVSIITIRDNDPPPAVSFALKDSRGDEGKGTAKIDVSLSTASEKKASIEYAVTGGTAVSSKNFVLKSGALVFEPGETTRTIDPGINNDKLYDDNKTIEVTLLNPVNAVLGMQAVHTHTIIENDPPPSVTFSASAQEVWENGGAVTVTAQLSAISGKDVALPFTLSGTAVDRQNYRLMTASPLTIRAGTTTGEIAMALMDNSLYEENRTIVLTMGTPMNATQGESRSHIVTVVDDDAPPRIAIMPFKNDTDRKYAGEIMLQHFLRELSNGKHFTVVEPGLITEKLLDYRILMKEGISLSDAELVAGELKADLILSGKVLDYQDNSWALSKPKVGFSLQLIDRRTREVVWSSSSRNVGDDAVYLFDLGRINTAHALAAEMARAVEKMAEQK